MTYNLDQLKQEARQLALQHSIGAKRFQPSVIWKPFYTDSQLLRDFVSFLHRHSAASPMHTGPAEEWLLDNAEFIEEQVIEVQTQLAQQALGRLPVLQDEASLRIRSVCEQYLDAVDGVFDEDTLLTYLNAYQEVSVLNLAETNAIPLVLRVALIGRLAKTMSYVRERREVGLEVSRLLAQLSPSTITSEAVSAQLEAAGRSFPLSGPWIVHLISQLREWAEDTTSVREWLICKFENGAEDLDRIVTYEHRLQASYQLTAGNLITSLRSNERRDWNGLFERISLLDRTLRSDPSGLYPQLDAASRNAILKRVETLSRRMNVTETLVAHQAMELAAAVFQSAEEQPRESFAAYYLFEPTGVLALQHSLRQCSQPRPLPGTHVKKRAISTYFAMLIGLLLLSLLAAAAWISAGQSLSPLGWAALAIALLLPASEWGITLLHLFIERCYQPRLILRYDFSSGVPADASTMVVIPAIWSNEEEVNELADRLEIHYLANRDPNIHYALLGDFTDAPEEQMPSDAALEAYATRRIEELGRKYESTGTTFHLYQRRRQWNASEGVFMGWERKRGKLAEFIELLGGDEQTSYHIRVGEREVLSRIQYLITLDADTQLPMGSAQRMIGTMHLPYNRPRLNASRTRVVEGYGVLQPRIGMSHQSAMRSRLAYYSAEPGVDPYAFAASDPYQDAFSHGIFTGKGILHVGVFRELLRDRIPQNSVLSHDLLEGGFLRTGLLSDIELIDDYPSTFSAYQKRMNRWVRGDWQLLCWLLPRVRDQHGTPRPVDLALVTRWQMLDNLRRSLLPIVYLILIVLGLTVLPGSPGRWLAFLGLTLLLPILRQLSFVENIIYQPKRLWSTAMHLLLYIWTLPFQAAVLLDAVIRTLYRVLVSKRRMLEWTSFSHIERGSKGSRRLLLLGSGAGILLIALVLLASLLQSDPGPYWSGIALCVLWATAPLGVRMFNQPVKQEQLTFTAEERTGLLRLAREIWAFYEDYATEQDHWLPPDNVQMDPPNGVAHRTSPTNIGFLLTAVIAARDFEFIDSAEMVERLERTIATIEGMDKWHGHLYNWYDTMTLSTLPPAYVSTVDSGNFVASLMTVKQALEHRLSVENDQGSWRDRAERLLERLESLIVSTDFRPLYDYASKLFVLGYHAASGRRDDILYDLLASEARQTSFVAIALGQISVSHWLALGRTVRKLGGEKTLVSWSGTMFEYLMPWLIMRTYRDTIWDSTYRGVVKRQLEYASQRGVPFGISESGYYAFDYQLNYQYRAFGVPGLGFKRGLELDLVLAPYAAVMALPFAGKEGLAGLERMEKLGARGKYGYYEAIDFTPERMPNGRTSMVIQSFMAHHQGMSLLTLANLLLPTPMYDYFHRDKRIQAAELLLQERIPARTSRVIQPLSAGARPPQAPALQGVPLRVLQGGNNLVPEVSIHSNGAFTSVVTDSGSGFIRLGGTAITRWREDPVTDHWGSYMYIRDVASNRVWSPTPLPCGSEETGKTRVQFTQDRAIFLSEGSGIESKLEVGVASDTNAEVRRLTLTNHSQAERILEVTTFIELAMAAPDADRAHPAFTKLFIETEVDEEKECMLARKRPRSGQEQAWWTVHKLSGSGASIGPAEYETDRAAFIGRGHGLSSPAGIAVKLGSAQGAVADPAFVMRRRLSLAPGAQTTLIAVTGAADTKEQAAELADRLATEQQADQVYQLAWTRSQIELQHMHLSPADIAVYGSMAGRVLYTAPMKLERERAIGANTFGQQGLWAHGISGDRPVVIAVIADIADLPFITKLSIGFDYLRRQGIGFDLVILNESAGGYQQDLQDALRRTMEQYASQAGGIHVLAAANLREEDKSLLFTVARLVLHADGASLKAQLKAGASRTVLPGPLSTTAPLNRYPAPQDTDDSSALVFFNGWGGFTPDGGREYRMLLKQGNPLPAPWINVMANREFGCLVSELGTGYTWWRNSRECKLTPWSNDPALDPPGEICYLRDEESGEYWMLGSTRSGGHPACTVSHGRGYTRFEAENNGLKQELTVFVPLENPIKILKVRLTNTTAQPRQISATYYAEWVLGVQREGNASYVVANWSGTDRALIARNAYQENFREAYAFLAVNAASAYEQSWTVDRQEFIGRGGQYESPAAMNRERLSGATGPHHESCGAVQAKLELSPGAEMTIYIVLGCTDSESGAAQLLQAYREPSYCEAAYAAVLKFWDDRLGGITLSTPSPELDIMMNNWLLYQSLACRMWARTAFYQAGGAYGYRDQLQDSLALLHSRPDLTRAQIVLHASHQYIEGDVQHWWHEETSRGIRTKFSDDLLWLPYAVSRYLEHTEDESVLEVTVPYLISNELSAEEHERYEETVQSEQSGTVMDHCLRAIERSLRFGEHGLPLMGIGDWNDGMSLVGAEGRGESVWLGWFQGHILGRFIELCSSRGDYERADRYKATRDKLAASLNESGWDGQWFRRAFTDSGDWLGSIHNAECRIDSIAQSWSVLSGLGADDKALQAMRSFDRELVNRTLNIAHILTPPFNRTDPSPGYIQGYPPGIRENGGQYTHGVIWSILAWCGLGDGDKAYDLFHMLNPISHTKTAAEVRTYYGEPYVMAADIYSERPHPGHAGWTWYTGASGWMYQAGLEWIVGIRRRGLRLHLKPCVPSSWPELTIQYRYGDSTYHLHVLNPSRKSAGISKLVIDNQEMDITVYSVDEGPFVELRDDGAQHDVVLTL
ncbi:GH36-type glycosyl hydrolase domain-containing protein [Paenibacillus sp. GCM10023252]|uniref:GH36-type glycosyl hydrolase domain-containing protein n=1 Tax=Paenibacillus sp. GCM10023252 TaxID=3252649 RepID=UPI00361DB35D